MRHRALRTAVVAIGLFGLSGAVWADKPAWAGGKHGDRGERAEERHEDRAEGRRETTVSIRFGEDTRRIIGDYYGAQARAGKCPPGLAKKHNGCLPPGQAKKWALGQPLPADLRYHELPRDLVLRLPPPPPRHRYVQIAGDVLLIAVGSSMVVDAVEDILR